jgi:hypothetical protein
VGEYRFQRGAVRAKPDIPHCWDNRQVQLPQTTHTKTLPEPIAIVKKRRVVRGSDFSRFSAHPKCGWTGAGGEEAGDVRVLREVGAVHVGPGG